MDEPSQAIDEAKPAETEKNLTAGTTRITDSNQNHAWSRSAEAGTTVVRLILTIALTILAVWLFSGWRTIHIAGIISVIGLFINGLAAYPLVIGAEKPDHSSPELAMKSYFESLEHHGPLYRRMWLLLATDARNCRSFNNYEGFRLYWKQKINEWRHRAGAFPLTPIVIQIRDYDKVLDNNDLNLTTISCQIDVLLRGRRAAGPVASYDFSTRFVQGSEGNWYLANGDLPEVPVGVGQAGLPSVPLANGQSAG